MYFCMKFKNILLGIGIFVVFTLVLHQGLQTFYQTPEWDDYCSFHSTPPITENGMECKIIPVINLKADACYAAKGEFVWEYDSNGCPFSGYCDACRIDYENALDIHSNRVFIISVIVGLITFIVGLFLLAKEPVGSALMASGIWSVFYGVVVNWRNFSNSWKFVLLFVLLILLIWLALKFNEKRKWGFFRNR
jgi:hypothetical protein